MNEPENNFSLILWLISIVALSLVGAVILWGLQ